jgi:hypothetical protein
MQDPTYKNNIINKKNKKFNNRLSIKQIEGKEAFTSHDNGTKIVRLKFFFFSKIFNFKPIKMNLPSMLPYRYMQFDTPPKALQ